MKEAVGVYLFRDIRYEKYEQVLHVHVLFAYLTFCRVS